MERKDGYKPFVKRLVIDYPEDKGAPEVTFVGGFTGRDIMTVGRIIAVAYRAKKNEIIRRNQELTALDETLNTE